MLLRNEGSIDIRISKVTPRKGSRLGSRGNPPEADCLGNTKINNDKAPRRRLPASAAASCHVCRGSRLVLQARLQLLSHHPCIILLKALLGQILRGAAKRLDEQPTPNDAFGVPN